MVATAARTSLPCPSRHHRFTRSPLPCELLGQLCPTASTGLLLSMGREAGETIYSGMLHVLQSR